ncbi:OmpH family outer membrane protein [Sphingomonas sp. H39-1-10]|uniref:OmpH family outer membrane protein n=1 Tax=Sphingomonas pollutisoli TaxID=3030829 RepID=UPI0023BA3A96|nr:OmpH family outer membrane protein [Sphingomonas pollutisoli]MDF0490479.1 OmpH family outer membrane protein [Sphingomonas pollutisoli]
MRRFLLLSIALASTAPARAQTAGPAPATAGLGGPLVAGVCLLSREAVFANAKVGQAMTARLRELAQQAQAEVDAERRPIEADIRAFNAESARLSADQRRTREQALAARLQPVDAKAAQRSREIDATRVKALGRVSTEFQPVVAQVYRQKGCGLLLDRNTVLGGNFGNDLTAAVVQGLDARIQTISFEREVLPPAAPAAQRP